MTNTQGEPQDQSDPTEIREGVEEELETLADKASSEEIERMAERDRTGVDEPNEEDDQSS